MSRWAKSITSPDQDEGRADRVEGHRDLDHRERVVDDRLDEVARGVGEAQRVGGGVGVAVAGLGCAGDAGEGVPPDEPAEDRVIAPGPQVEQTGRVAVLAGIADADACGRARPRHAVRVVMHEAARGARCVDVLDGTTDEIGHGVAPGAAGLVAGAGAAGEVLGRAIGEDRRVGALQIEVEAGGGGAGCLAPAVAGAVEGVGGGAAAACDRGQPTERVVDTGRRSS